MRTKDSWINN